MTLGAVGFGRGFPRIWLLPILTLIGVLLFAVAGRLSRAIVADLAAWWPVWVSLAIVAYLVRRIQVGPLQVAGLVPLLAFAMVIVFVWGHVAGWSLMPSAQPRLVGPSPDSYTSVSLEAAIDGELHVNAGSEALYEVRPIRSGGAIGMPGAAEQNQGFSLSVLLEENPDPGVYSYAGWDVTVAPNVKWDLKLDGAVDGDLAALPLITSLDLAGAGTVALGTPDGDVPIAIHGDYRLEIPPDVPASVTGIASVPATWTLTSGGASSPAGTDGWVITVDPGASLIIGQG